MARAGFAMKRQRGGFSLLELAVVLAILSVIVGFGVNIGQNAVKHGTRLAMLEKMALIKQSLDDYAERNGYLPCPADPTLLPGNAAFGQQSKDFSVEGGSCIGLPSPANVWIGMVPTQDLGLDDSYATDAWGNKITYAVSRNHIGFGGATPYGISSYATQPGTIIVNSNTLAAPITLTTTFAGAPGEGATYFVVSHGKDARGAIGINATAPAIACAGGSIDTQNCDRADNIFFDSTYNEGNQNATKFDDYVAWGTNTTLRDPSNFLPTNCPGTRCEPWCAPCEIGGMSRAPQSPDTPKRLCSKFITRNYPNCEARCIWRADDRPCP